MPREARDVLLLCCGYTSVPSGGMADQKCVWLRQHTLNTRPDTTALRKHTHKEVRGLGSIEQYLSLRETHRGAKFGTSISFEALRAPPTREARRSRKKRNVGHTGPISFNTTHGGSKSEGLFTPGSLRRRRKTRRLDTRLPDSKGSSRGRRLAHTS